MQSTDFSCIILAMIINFNEISETEIQHMHNGDSFICAKMMMTPESKVMYQRLPAGSSIGRHKMTNGSETNYIISGSGSQICDGVEEVFSEGMCIYCPKDSSHSITNTGNSDLILFTVISLK